MICKNCGQYKVFRTTAQSKFMCVECGYVEGDRMAMNFDKYQVEARKTAIYPKIGVKGLMYPVLGLCGEAGEVAEKVKKLQRDKNGKMSLEDRQEIKKELGDVLWYVAAIANQLNLSLSKTAEANLEKLHSRQERDKLKGEGDNR